VRKVKSNLELFFRVEKAELKYKEKLRVKISTKNVTSSLYAPPHANVSLWQNIVDFIEGKNRTEQLSF
jgi:hypothetical protein